MEEKLKLIDEISTLVIGLDIDIYLQNQDMHAQICVSNATSGISDKLFNLKQLIEKDHGSENNK